MNPHIPFSHLKALRIVAAEDCLILSNIRPSIRSVWEGAIRSYLKMAPEDGVLFVELVLLGATKETIS